MIRKLGRMTIPQKAGGIGLLALVMAVVGVANAFAAGPIGNTYFEGVGGSKAPIIGPKAEGSDSLWGSVLPNYTGWGDGSGAIGDTIMNMKTPGNVSRQEKFYNLLHWQYTSGNAWEKAGSAQIALSLLGNDFVGTPRPSRTVTNAQWNDLRARLVDNSDLDMVWRGTAIGTGVSRRSNTAGVVANTRYDSIRWDNGDDASVDAWEFRSRSTGTTYALFEIACGNGIGNVNALPKPNAWSTSGQSLVGVGAGSGWQQPNVPQWPIPSTPHDQEPRPGDTLYFNHTISNTTNGTTPQMTAAVERSGFSAASGLNGNQYPYAPGAKFSLGPKKSYAFGRGTGEGGNYNAPNQRQYFTYVLSQDDVGAGYYGRDKICQYTSWSHWWTGYKDGDTWNASSTACVSVPFNFSLTPTASASQTSGEPGAAISPISLNVNNKAASDTTTRSYAGISWELVRFVVPKGANPKATSTGRPSPCSYYGNGCKTIKTGTQTYEPGSNAITPSVAVDPIDDVALGSQVGFALSTMDYNQAQPPSGGNWRYGAADCVKVGKTPKFQAWSGDVAARGSINTSTTVKGSDIFGSWVEYGAFSVGANSGFASSAGLIGQTSNSQADWSRLTFANVNNNGTASSFGRITQTAADFRKLPTVASYFKSFTTTQQYGSGDLNSNAFATGGPVTVRRANNLTLGAGQLDAGKSVVIVADGTVTIDGDITYTGASLGSFKDLPQLVIIAKDIRITDKVKNVDAWLVASGYVDTCSNVGTPGQMPASGTVMKGDVCAERLTINGPVIGNRLILKRTAGSGTAANSGDPAEVVNLRPDAYLWAEQVAAGGGKAQTVHSIELPPRF